RLRTACDPRWHPFLALGVGCALAKLRHELPEGPAVRDGYGFQLGLMERGWHPRGRPTTPEVERGRGRGLWFVAAGNADLCARLIGDAPHEDARWRGVGTACAFAGDPLGHAHRLPDLAGPWRPCIVDGARDALRMWRSLGPPPRRVLDTLAALDPTLP
ncbi:MAG: DUF1702 family protein, partial [Actinobacteria bacterium]|nr:DUF1702 family protein [Actinomycetota bacterium]